MTYIFGPRVHLDSTQVTFEGEGRSRAHEKIVAEVVGATSSEPEFLVVIRFRLHNVSSQTDADEQQDSDAYLRVDRLLNYISALHHTDVSRALAHSVGYIIVYDITNYHYYIRSGTMAER